MERVTWTMWEAHFQNTFSSCGVLHCIWYMLWEKQCSKVIWGINEITPLCYLSVIEMEHTWLCRCFTSVKDLMKCLLIVLSSSHNITKSSTRYNLWLRKRCSHSGGGLWNEGVLREVIISTFTCWLTLNSETQFPCIPKLKMCQGCFDYWCKFTSDAQLVTIVIIGFDCRVTIVFF